MDKPSAIFTVTSSIRVNRFNEAKYMTDQIAKAFLAFAEKTMCSVRKDGECGGPGPWVLNIEVSDNDVHLDAQFITMRVEG